MATEHTHRSSLKDLLERLDSKIKATKASKQVEYGAADYILPRVRLTLVM